MSDQSIKIQKRRKGGFTIVHNRILQDHNLSYKAKGIYAYLIGRPENWVITMSDVIKNSKDGRESVLSGMKELRNAGYCKLVKDRDSGGKLIGSHYVVYEDPDDLLEEKTTENGVNRQTGFPTVGFPESRESPLPNKKEERNNTEERNKIEFSENKFSAHPNDQKSLFGNQEKKIEEPTDKQKRFMANLRKGFADNFLEGPYKILDLHPNAITPKQLEQLVDKYQEMLDIKKIVATLVSLETYAKGRKDVITIYKNPFQTANNWLAKEMAEQAQRLRNLEKVKMQNK